MIKFFIYLPLLVCIISGILFYVNDPQKRPKLDALTLHAFWVGLFITLWNSGKFLQ